MCLKELHERRLIQYLRKIKIGNNMNFHKQRTKQTDCDINKMKNYKSIKNEYSEEYLMLWQNGKDIRHENRTKTATQYKLC